MINKKYVHFLTFIILFTLISFAMQAGEKSNDGKKQLNKTNTNDNNKYIAINQIFMWVSNYGMG